MKKKKSLHFVAGSDIDWTRTAKLPRRPDGGFAGVVERRPKPRKGKR